MTKLILAVGWVINFIIFCVMVSKDPEGGMGTIPIMVIGLIPYSLGIVGIISKIQDWFDGRK